MTNNKRPYSTTILCWKLCGVGFPNMPIFGGLLIWIEDPSDDEAIDSGVGWKKCFCGRRIV